MPEQQKFLQYDYGETKDLLKTFITLISGTLVLTLTFSEKIVTHPGASRAADILIESWILFIVALICAGLGTCFIAAAAGKVLYGAIPIFNFSYWKLAVTSWTFVLVAGISYVAGLAMLVRAAAWAMGG